MKFVNQSQPATTKELAVGSLVIETNGERLSPDSVTGLKVDDYHVLALGDKEAKLVHIEDGVDNHFKTTVPPSKVGIGLEQSVMDIINKAMETSTYTDHELDFPQTDNELYEQVKGSVPMPIDKEPSIFDSLVAILSNGSITKYGRLNGLTVLRDNAETSDEADLIDEAIKDLKGKHLSAVAIANKYKAIVNDIQANYVGEDDKPEPKSNENMQSAGKSIAKAVSKLKKEKVTDTLAQLVNEAKSHKIDAKDPEDDGYLKFLGEYFGELKKNKLSNSEIVDYLDKLQFDDDDNYLSEGISNLKDKIKSGVEDAGKMLDLAKDELDSQFKLRLGLDKLLSLFGYEEDTDEDDEDEDLKDFFDEVFFSYYEEGAPSEEDAKLLVEMLNNVGHIQDKELCKFTKKFVYKLTEDNYKDNAEKIMANLAEEYEQKF